MFGMDIWVTSTGIMLFWAGGWSFFRLFADAKKGMKR